MSRSQILATALLILAGAAHPTLARAQWPASELRAISRSDPSIPSATPACSSGLAGPDALSDDATVMALLSCAPNLLPGGETRHYQVLVHTPTGFELVTRSAADPAVPSNDDAEAALVSADGSMVAFSSAATDLVPGYSGDSTQVYVLDRTTGTIRLVSHAWDSPSAGGDGNSRLGSLSADNRFLLVSSSASNLIQGSTGVSQQVYLYDLQTGDAQLVSHAPGSTTVGADTYTQQATMDSGASRVVFASPATNLVAGYSGTGNQLYSWERSSGAVALLSHASGFPLAGCTGGIHDPQEARSGSLAIYLSAAPDLLPASPGDADQAYAYDFATGETSLVSSDLHDPSSGANRYIWEFSMSQDGHVVAMSTQASNLVPPGNAPPFGFVQVVLINRLTGQRRLLSHASDSDVDPGNESSSRPVLTDDGDRVLFRSQATDLVANYVGWNYQAQLYSFRVDTGEIRLLSHPPGLPLTGSSSNSYDYARALPTQDGSLVVFNWTAHDLVADDWDSGDNVFTSDGEGGDPELVTRRPPDLLPSRTANSASLIADGHPQLLSADGRYALFKSYAVNLAPGLDPSCWMCERLFLYDAALDRVEVLDRAGAPLDSPVDASISAGGRWLAITGRLAGAEWSDWQIFLFDRATGVVKLASHAWSDPGSGGDAQCSGASISANAPVIVFRSRATDLVQGYSGSDDQVFVYDGTSDSLELISHVPGAPSTAGNGASLPVGISQDGRWVVFVSAATDLLANYSGSGGQVYRYDRWTGSIELVSHALGSLTTGADQSTGAFDVSQDGSRVFLQSGAANLIGNPAPATSYQLFVWTAAGSTIGLVSHAVSGPANFSNGAVRSARASGDGSAVVFASEATDLIAGYSGTGQQVYLADLTAGETRLLSHALQGPLAGCSYGAFNPVISADGSRAAFVSDSWDLVAGNYWGQMDVYAVDRAGNGELEFLSPPLYQAWPVWQLQSWPLDISGDGRTILFNSDAGNLIPRDWNGSPDVFLSIRWPPGTVFVDGFETGDATRWSSQHDEG